MTMAIVAVGATIISGVISAAGAMEQAQANQNMMNYQAAVAAQNAQIEREQAQRELAVGETEAQKQGMQTHAQIGGIIAQEGASGLDVRSGSPLAVQTSAEKLGQFNEALVRNDAARRAYDYEVKGYSDEAQSRLYAFGAANQPIAGAYSAAGALVGAAGTAASRWYQFSNPTASGGLIG